MLLEQRDKVGPGLLGGQDIEPCLQLNTFFQAQLRFALDKLTGDFGVEPLRAWGSSVDIEKRKKGENGESDTHNILPVHDWQNDRCLVEAYRQLAT